jgi:hypothetical protein
MFRTHDMDLMQLKALPLKDEHCSYVKIAVLRGGNARECHAELREALGDRALPSRTVARWVEAFKRGRVSTADLHCSSTH